MDNTTLIYSFSPSDSRPFVQTNAFFESRLQVIRPGSSLRLECSASGAPTPNLKWFLDDRLLKAVSLFARLACHARGFAPPTHGVSQETVSAEWVPRDLVSLWMVFHGQDWVSE